MVDIDMMAYLENLKKARSGAEVQRLLLDEFQKLNVHRYYYIFVPPYSLFDKNQITFFQSGYDSIPGFVRDFETYLKSDEANSYFNFHRHGSTRADYPASRELDSSLEKLVVILKKYKNHLNLQELMTVPVYGAKSHFGYFHMPAEKKFDSPKRRLLFEFLCQNAHQRNVELSLSKPRAIKLSPREKEVLLKLVRGKNNSAIAKELEISRHTVDEYIRRIFIKLDVHDRVTASLKALKLFLLENDMPKNELLMDTAVASDKSNAA